MNSEVKKLWCNALRNKEYLQGLGRLRVLNNDGKLCFCPLGVLCDLFLKAPENKNYKAYWRGPGLMIDDEYTWIQLPTVVADWAGLTREEYIYKHDPVLKLGDHPRNCTVSACNDAYKMTFEQIADLIEVNL